MDRTKTIVVLGATGSVGGQVTAQLAGSGHRVRGVGRNAAALGELARRYGIEPYVADLTAPETLAPPLDGADAVFLVFASDAADPDAEQVVTLLAQDGRRIVHLSADVGDDTFEQDGILGSHARLERLVRTHAREWTFLRASGFATNTLGWAPQIAGGGEELRWFGPEITRALVHEADLAAVGVRALTEDGHHGRAYRLSGPEALTQVEQLAAISDAVGRPLRFVDVGPDDALDLFVGVPVELAREIVSGQLAMVEHPEVTTGEIERLTGHPGRTYAQWTRDHVESFR